MTLEEATEGVRRAMLIQDPTLQSRTDEYATEEQCRDLALALLTEANIDYVQNAKDVEAERINVDPSSPHHMVYDMFRPVQAAMLVQSLAGKAILNGVGIVSKYCTTEHGKYHYFDSSPDTPDVPPIVMLHGMFTTAVSMGLLGALVAQHRRVIIPDMLEFDFGWSRTHNKEQLSWTGHIPAMVEFIRSLGHCPVDVVGHSYGGWMAARICRDFPDVIHRNVLLAPGGLGRYRSLQSARSLLCR